MRKAVINAFVDAIALILFIPSLISGVVLYVVLPSGGGGFRGGTSVASADIFLGIARSDWKDLHTYTSLAFAALIIVHLLLHWRYMRSLGRIFRGTRTDTE
ncbi:hypothetical protein ABH15_01315 [Methanoculleus taiwanensis]|uniref:Flavinylation-associated cytochrome domain-containing protein n=1 Tax=Methanoculleus taiwanensis TaxID=1550565 RepID=A0A498H3L9_9EURY|nr:DUF4405 domain-containing protein [Methanoculleus taiwanensis]RXE56825.1 hypothetical protein ABH15_01315 [Methanoculleus taiwanensis]